jgi:hypothetical protein
MCPAQTAPATSLLLDGCADIDDFADPIARPLDAPFCGTVDATLSAARGPAGSAAHVLRDPVEAAVTATYGTFVLCSSDFM